MSLVLDQVEKVMQGETHLYPVSLDLAKGSLNVLLGATLSGKTSLMRIMAGLDTPSSGRVLVDGQDVTGWPVRRRNVAMVYQQFINYPSLTVRENIASPLSVAGLSRGEIGARVQEAARLLKLEPYLERRPLELSGGQQQRTALARALVKRAELVLLDEPLANLDYKLREELREELPRIFAATGAILVYATTEPAEALLLGGSTATLHQGRVTAFGRTASVYRHPGDLATARVFSDPPLNVITAVKSNGRVRFSTGGEARAAGGFAHVPDGSYKVGIRAHHLALAPMGDDPVSFPGIVSVSEITGSESFVHLDAGEHRLVALLTGVHRLEPGTMVAVHLDPSRLLVFDAAGQLAGQQQAA